jgi:hypothetical protein
MTRQEAVGLIETWITEQSSFAAQVVEVTPGEQGAWVMLIECSELTWQQMVSPDGRVSAPEMRD